MILVDHHFAGPSCSIAFFPLRSAVPFAARPTVYKARVRLQNVHVCIRVKEARLQKMRQLYRRHRAGAPDDDDEDVEQEQMLHWCSDLEGYFECAAVILLVSNLGYTFHNGTLPTCADVHLCRMRTFVKCLHRRWDTLGCTNPSDRLIMPFASRQEDRRGGAEV